MGLYIVLVTELGEELGAVSEPAWMFEPFLRPLADTSFQCFRFIDRYGLTIFNGLQIPTFLSELERVRVNAHTDAEQDLLNAIKDLAVRCREEPHRYLKFIGD